MSGRHPALTPGRCEITFEKTTGDELVKIGAELIAYIEAFKRDQIELSQHITDPALAAAVVRQAAATTEVALSVGRTIITLQDHLTAEATLRALDG